MVTLNATTAPNVGGAGEHFVVGFGRADTTHTGDYGAFAADSTNGLNPFVSGGSTIGTSNVAGAMSFVINDTLYVFGGKNQVGTYRTQGMEISVCNVDCSSGPSLSSSPNNLSQGLSTPRYLGGLVYDVGQFYCIGGSDGAALATVEQGGL